MATSDSNTPKHVPTEAVIPPNPLVTDLPGDTLDSRPQERVSFPRDPNHTNPHQELNMATSDSNTPLSFLNGNRMYSRPGRVSSPGTLTKPNYIGVEYG